MRAFTILALTLQATLLAHASPVAEPQDIDLEARSLEARAACQGGAGECVTYYGGSNCQTPLGSYRPTCAGNCFQYASFSSLYTIGSTIPALGTSCTVYSDDNCLNKITDTGNHIPTKCTSFSQARSMKCYYNCHH